MQDTNIEFIEQARNHLINSQIEACFGTLDIFFKKIQAPPESSIQQLNNELLRIKTRHNHLNQQKPVVSVQNYISFFNQITDTLHTLIASIIDETQRLTVSSSKPNEKSQNNTVKITLEVNVNFDNFSEEQAIDIVNKIRGALNVGEEKFKYLNIKQGSVLINIQATRNYELIIKLKSLVESDIIDSWVSTVCDDVVMDRFCTAMKNLELNLSHKDLPEIDSSKTKERLDQYIDSIRQLISKNNIKEAIAEMQNLLKSSPSFDEIILQSSRYNDVMKSVRMGVISHEASSVELRKIDYALIDMLRELEDNYTSNITLQTEIHDFLEKETEDKRGNTITITGDNNTVIQDLGNSTININQSK